MKSKSFNKLFILLLFPFILVCCNRDDNPIDEFTPPTISFEVNGSEIIMDNFYAIKNDNRLVIVMENDSNERLEIKLNDLPDGSQGYFLLSQVSTINFWDGNTNTAHTSKNGNSFFTGDSIFIENYDLGQKNISANFNSSLYDTPSNIIQIEHVDFDLQFEESIFQDTYSASLNGNQLSTDSTSFGTDYNTGHIYFSQKNQDGFIYFSFPLDVETGEYNLSPLVALVSNSFIPMSGAVYMDGIDSFTLTATVNIVDHSPMERKIKGNVIIENSANNIIVDFDGFYF
jgi:hypothetical protein